MCIAIYKPEDSVISKETLERCFNSNPDGAGFMYVENKELHMQKGYFTFKDFWKNYKKHENKQAVIHFRIKTHGKIDEHNCHPFMINKGIGFVHNGIISGFGVGDKSDTNHFNEEIIKPLVAKWGNLALFQPAIKSLVESRIGYSKLIFLDRHGNYDIFNENKGSWDNGVWYSNNSYKPVVITPPPAQKSLYPVYSKYYSPPSKKDTLEVGDLVELTRNHYDNATKETYFKGELFEVVAVNMNYTVDLMGDIDDEKHCFLYDVPYTAINKLDDSLDDDEVIATDEFYNTPVDSTKYWGY